MTGIDWQGTARKGQLTRVLHLFACRLAWLRHGDLRAHGELIRASEHADPEIRAVAANLLTQSGTAEPRNQQYGPNGCETGR